MANCGLQTWSRWPGVCTTSLTRCWREFHCIVACTSGEEVELGLWRCLRGHQARGSSATNSGSESQPCVHDTLVDIANSGQQTFCNVLPRPSKFIWLASGSPHVSAIGDKTTPSSHARRCEDRRRAVQGDTREANPSKLSDFSWDNINATANALSNDKKPGKYFR